MSLFAGMARQAAALPPIQPQAQPQRRGLIGGGRPSVNMGEALGFLIGGPRYVGNMRQGQRDDMAAQQAAQLAEQQRAQRDQYAATIQDPRERQLFLTAPDQWAENIGQQFAPQVVAAGASQVVNGRRTVEQPTYSDSGDTILERSSAGVSPVFTRTTPSISEQTAQQNADTTRFSAQSGAQVAQGQLGVAQGRLGLDQQNSGFTLGQNQTRFNADGSPVASVTPPQASNQAQSTAAMNAISNTREAIDRARGQTGFWTTGPLAALPFNTPSRDLNATLDTVKANLSFNELAQMRANSPTGGALGSIAVRELDLLGSTVASLDQSQSREELERSLSIIEQSLNRWEQAVQAGQSQAPQGQGPIAVNPQTGARVQWNGQAWVPM